jgi:catechol 2,3-dioxygenase-like lactoylglutathione lyase family enzyme
MVEQRVPGPVDQQGMNLHMDLKHLNMTTSEVVADAEFFERFFGFEIRHKGGKEGNGIAILCDDDNFILALMKPDATGVSDYPGTFHFGFYISDAEGVEAKHEELEKAGVEPGKIQHLTRGGNVTTFYVKAPGGYDVEVCTPPDQMIKG